MTAALGALAQRLSMVRQLAPFLIFVPVLIALAIVLDPRKHDWLQRGLCRRIAYFSGAK